MDDKILSFIPKIYFPESLFFGSRSLPFLKTIPNSKKIFIASATFYTKNKELVKELTDGARVIKHSGEPTEKDIKSIKNKSKGAKNIIALGGGSIIDLVKVVKKDLGIKMVAIPTTIGSGAEVSRFSLIIDSKTRRKIVINSPELLPEVVIYNPLLFKTIPRDEIIYQTIDAFSHAIESLVSKMSNPFSDMLSIIATDNLYECLDKLSRKKELNEQILEKIITGSFFAGLAQSSAATGLTHSLAHYFGSQNNIPHAKAVSMFLLDVLEVNAKATDKYKKLNDSKNLSDKNFLARLRKLFIRLGLNSEKISLAENISVSSEKIRQDISALSNPYSPKSEEIEAIIRRHS